LTTLRKPLLAFWVVLAVIFATSLFALVKTSWSVDLPGEWQTRAPSGTIRQEVSYVEAGGKFYLAGGTTKYQGLTLHERYDPATNSWSEVAPLPKNLTHIQAVELGGNIYYIGGIEGSASGPHGPHSDNVFVYDPGTDTFSEGAPMPDGRGRGASGTAVYNGKIYYAGGQHDAPDGVYNPRSKPWFDVYNPTTDTWTQLPNMPRARDHFHAAVVDGKFYAIGGRQTSNNNIVTAVDVYDLSQGAAGTWQTPNTVLPTPRSGFTTAVLGQEILVIGGEGGVDNKGGPAFNTVEAYNTATNSWRTLEPMPTGLHGTQAVVCNGGVYLAAGSDMQGTGPTNVQEMFSLNGATGCGDSSDTQIPDTTITSGRSGTINDDTPTFTFTGLDDQTATADLRFSYKVDDGAWSAYQAGTSVTLGGATGLSDGPHTFQVRARDEAGNEDPSPAQRSFTVDTVKPTVESVVPVDGATGIDSTANASALFSETMSLPSINTKTFKLFKKGTTTVIPATVTYDAANDLATLNPSADLQPGTTYKALVTIGTRDLAGNQLATSKA
jgi:N-acetylneuraminic acid mutarotase